MKKNYLTLLLIVFAISCTFFSCKKDNPQPGNNSGLTKVEYQIDTISNSFVNITYTDSTGTPVVLTHASQFPGGLKTIYVSSKPFTAKITTEVNNQTNTPLHYSLVILVDGISKKVVADTALSYTTSTITSAQYTIQ